MGMGLTARGAKNFGSRKPRLKFAFIVNQEGILRAKPAHPNKQATSCCFKCVASGPRLSPSGVRSCLSLAVIVIKNYLLAKPQKTAKSKSSDCLD